MDGTSALIGLDLEKRGDSLVFEVKKADGTSLTEAEYQTLKEESELGPAPFSEDSRRRPFKTCAEGDSWVNILWPLSKIKGFNESFVDIIEADPRCYVNNIGWPGDEFSDIVAKEQYRGPIQSGIFGFFILSGGGNDFLGGRSLARFVSPFSTGGGSNDPVAYVRRDNLRAIFDEVERGYLRIIDNVRTWSPATQILLHGYDHAIPRSGGPWMGTPFSALGYDVDSPITASIIKLVVDDFYQLLDGVARNKRNVHVIDVRGKCANHWHDELHPDHVAAVKIADSFLEKMQDLSPTA